MARFWSATARVHPESPPSASQRVLLVGLEPVHRTACGVDHLAS